MKRPRNLTEWGILCAVSAIVLAALAPLEAIHKARERRAHAALADQVDDEKDLWI